VLVFILLTLCSVLALCSCMAIISSLLMSFICAVDNSRVVLTGASNDYINASHLKVS